MKRSIDEAYVMDTIEREAETYYKKYRPYMQLLESVAHWKKFRKPNEWDYRALGKMLESVDEMVKMCENMGTVADLGILPKIARDVVTIVYGTSPLPIIASIQPLDEEVGLVYYKRVKAVSGGGNISAGDVIVSVYGDFVTPQGFSNAEVTETIGTGDGSTTTFTATLTYKPVRPGTVSVVAGNITAQDYNYDGKLLGEGVKGTIDYGTGEIEVTFDEAPANGVNVVATYWGNVEDLQLGVREINYELDTKQVRAKIYALKGMTGLFKSWQFQKRFGRAAEEELATDLINAINSEIMGDLIRKMKAMLPGSVTWSASVPSGVSYFEHKQSFKDAVAGAERYIIENSKRGKVSFIIAGTKVCSVIRTLFGWNQLYDGRGMFGAYLFGELDGIPVINVPDTSLLEANRAIVGYKGVSDFEAPAVFCPYMPITVTTVLPTVHPLVTQRAVACWAAVEVLINRFLYGLTVSGSLPYES